MTKDIHGHIDCPACGTAKGMRITHDKNGKPFGFCEAECGQQLRIGGSERRVKLFLARHPWAAGKPVTVTVTEPTQPQPAPKKPVKAPAPTPPAPEPAAPPAKKHGWLVPIMGGD